MNDSITVKPLLFIHAKTKRGYRNLLHYPSVPAGYFTETLIRSNEIEKITQYIIYYK